MKSKFLEYLIRESSSFKSKIYQNRNTHPCPNFYFDQFINGYFIPEKPIFGNFKVPLFTKLKKKTFRILPKSIMELFAKVINGFWPLYIFAKKIDDRLGPKSAAGMILPFEVGLSNLPKKFDLLQWKAFKNHEKCFLSLRLEGEETLKYRCLSAPIRKSSI